MGRIKQYSRKAKATHKNRSKSQKKKSVSQMEEEDLSFDKDMQDAKHSQAALSVGKKK